MELKTKSVVSLLASENKITLFTVSGEVLDLKADGPHDTVKITEYLAPKLSGGNVVDIDLSEFLVITSALAGPEYEDEGIVITRMIEGKEVQGIFFPEKVKVSVVHGGEEHEVPNVENLNKHIKRAADEKSPAVRNFLRRLAPVIANRRHSAEDLMEFIKRSELPLTNDGRIIGYKRVQAANDGNYADCHTGRVVQNVGSRVWMEIDLVDASRDRSCSQGLHVANLGYLKGFRGSNTLIVLVNPEDFIAVPRGEDTKCRVASYDVVGVLKGSSHEVVNSGSHIKGDSDLKTLLKNVVEGNTPPITEKVKVGSAGAVLERVPYCETILRSTTTEAPSSETKEASGESLEEDTSNAKEAVDMVKKTKTKNWDAIPANVRDVFDDLIKEQLSKTKIAEKHSTSTRSIGRWVEKYDFEGYKQSKIAPPTELTVAQHARQLFEQAAYDTLVAFKKAKKKGWQALGFNLREVNRIEKAVS